MSNLQEIRLIEALKNDSSDAFSEIHRMYASRLYAFCLRWTKREEDAEDIVQDVFVKLWNERHNIRQKDTLSSLIFIMARHQLINAFRATLRSPVFEDYVDYRDRLAANDTDPMEYSEFIKFVDSAIDALPPTRRSVVRLSKFAGRSNREIAVELQLQEQTVKNQLSIGLKELQLSLSRFKIIILIPTLFLVNLTH